MQGEGEAPGGLDLDDLTRSGELLPHDFFDLIIQMSNQQFGPIPGRVIEEPGIVNRISHGLDMPEILRP